MTLESLGVGLPDEVGPETGVVITIDGPAGSGKSTTARVVADRLGFRHLDSGALYRALTHALLAAGVQENQLSSITGVQLARIPIALDPVPGAFRVLVRGEDPGPALRTPEVTRFVPVVAQVAVVRDWLLFHQRHAPVHGGIVADGRDMGTVVFPQAKLKVFLTASLEERARRRILQSHRVIDTPTLLAEAERIRSRDEMDSERELAPLMRPEGALEVDTTQLSFEEQVEKILRAARDHLTLEPSAE